VQHYIILLPRRYIAKNYNQNLRRKNAKNNKYQQKKVADVKMPETSGSKK